MKDYIKDDIIEELWRIKDEFSSSCNKDMKKIIDKMNRIAEKQDSLGEEVNLRKKLRPPNNCQH